MPETGPVDAPEIDGFIHARLLGSGGFSDVHLYQQRFPRRSVAIKVLKIETLDRELRRQFVAEANVMAQLSTHPAIATIYSADITSDGRPYLVMEFCSGGSLGTAYRTTPHSVEEVLTIGIRVASALESAHRAGVVHRDVKPANILITDYGVPVLTDFGISVGEEGLSESTVFRTEHSTATMTTGNAGTTQGLSVPWAPPEAFDDLPSNDERSDIYSLGATLFTLLEGRSPFEVPGGNNSALHLSRRIERGEIVAGTREVPAALSALLMRSVAVSRADRPQTAKEFGMAMQDIQKELGFAVTPLDLVTVAATGAISEADQVTRLRPSAKVDTATKHIPDQVTAETQIRVPPPPPPGVAIPATADRRMSRGQLALIGAISAGVLLLSGTGIAIAVSVSNASQAALAQQTEEPEAPSDEPGGDVEVGTYPTELIPSAFTAVDPAAFADPGYSGRVVSGAHFMSPSLNLGCTISGANNDDLWGCLAATAWWTWPDGAGDYCYDPDDVSACSSGIEAEGDELPHPRRRGDEGFPAAVSVLSGNSYALRVLEYGQSVTYGDVTCYSELRGMTCVDARTDHGFVIAKDLNTIF